MYLLNQIFIFLESDTIQKKKKERKVNKKKCILEKGEIETNKPKTIVMNIFPLEAVARRYSVKKVFLKIS